MFDSHFTDLLRHKFIQRFLYAILFFSMAMGAGIGGFMLIEGFSLIDAFYMTIITISTVGFQEVHDLSENGRIFTGFLILFNIGALTYSVGVVSAFIFEWDLKSVLKENQMKRELEKLDAHVVVCGYGRLGRIVCKDLEEHGRKVLIVERSDKITVELDNEGKTYLIGDATEDSTIVKMRIGQATTIITTFHSDAANIFVVLAAREINRELKIISRASTEANVSKLKLAGADHIIIPEDIGGSYIASLVSGTEHVAIGKWEY